ATARPRGARQADRCRATRHEPGRAASGALLARPEQGSARARLHARSGNPMTRLLAFAGVAPALAFQSVPAQSLARRVFDAPDGAIQFSFASRPGVCGDGATYVRDGLGGNNRIYEGGNFSGHTRGDDWPPCFAGPVRIVASMSGGELLRLRTYAGPVRGADAPPRDLGVVSVADAADLPHRVVVPARGRAPH